MEDDDMDIIATLSSSDEESTTTAPGGSQPGKSRNRDRQREHGHQRIMRDYFEQDSVYDAATFYRRFRLPRALVDEVFVQLNQIIDSLC